MNDLRITYRSRSNATPEAELNALVNVYAYLMKSHDSKKIAEHASESDGHDATIVRNKKEMTV